MSAFVCVLSAAVRELPKAIANKKHAYQMRVISLIHTNLLGSVRRACLLMEELNY